MQWYFLKTRLLAGVALLSPGEHIILFIISCIMYTQDIERKLYVKFYQVSGFYILLGKSTYVKCVKRSDFCK